MTDYRVVRSRRRTVALQVDQTGSVVVRAPMALPAEEIRTFVEKHETWIRRQQQRQARYRAEHPELTPQEQEALRQQAKAHLPQRVAYWAGVMGVRPTGIRITSARTRFGSCSGKNSLCFSLYLMAYPPEAIEYVVVHELAHIRHKNHSPAFYAEVERCLRGSEVDDRASPALHALRRPRAAAQARMRGKLESLLRAHPDWSMEG